MALPAPPLLLVTDRTQARHPLPEIVAAALAAGCRWIGVREKDLGPGERRALLAGLLALARPHGGAVTVHGDLDAALATGASGVHLPSGGDVAGARRALGPGRLLGLSCHEGGEVAAGLAAGADYVTLGPVAETASKPGYAPTLGAAAFAAVCRAHPGRVVALGGVTPGAVPGLLAAGAGGIAVMGPVMRAADPAAAIRGYLAEIAVARRSRA